jgi:hypothetical protein
MTENGLDRDAALAVVDEALESGRVTADDPYARELQDLALALEAESELPDDDFARALGTRVAAGFPHRRRWFALPVPGTRGAGGRSTRAAGVRPLRGRALALTGAAAALLVIVGVALSVSGGEPASRDLDAQMIEADSPAPAGVPPTELQRAEDGPAEAAAGGGSGSGQQRVAPGEDRRRIERSAELTLAAPEDEVDEVADGVIRVTDRHRGFVLRSSVSSGGDSDPGGTFDLRIPADQLQAAIRDLSKLGHVRARRQAGQDVTPVYVAARDRLTAAKAERRSLLRRLAGAGSDGEAERLRRRLDVVNMRIVRVRRELGALSERTDYAAVSVELEARGDSGGAGGGGTGEAFDDALALLEGSLGVALRALGVLIPLAIVAGLGWLAGSVLRRRRREAALR